MQCVSPFNESMSSSGGGGAGGVLSGTFSLAAGTYPVTIGSGRAGTPSSGNGGSGLCIVRYLSE